MPIDKGTSKPITQLNSLQINYKDKNSCFNPPIVTMAERDALVNTDDPAKPIKDGTLIFNSDSGYEEYYSQAKGGWIPIKENAGGGTGDVTGPSSAIDNNIPVFNDTSGKKIKDGGVAIKGLPLKSKALNATPLYQLSNLGALQFGSNENTADTGVILVDGLTPVTFQTQGTGAEARVCTVINGELGEGSSSPSALLEINSTEGGLLHARMTTAQRDALIEPKDGLEVYNTDTKNLNIRQNGAWVEIKSGGSGGTGDVTGPSSAIDNNIPVFNDTSGKKIADSGLSAKKCLYSNVSFLGLVSLGKLPVVFNNIQNSFETSYAENFIFPENPPVNGQFLQAQNNQGLTSWVDSPTGQMTITTIFQQNYTTQVTDTLILISANKNQSITLTLDSTIYSKGKILTIKSLVDEGNIIIKYIGIMQVDWNGGGEITLKPLDCISLVLGTDSWWILSKYQRSTN